MTTTTRKQITAKYTGKCVRCGGVIPSGTQCTWKAGEGVRHINCTVTAVAEYNRAADYQHAADNALGAQPAQRNNGSVSVTMGVFKKDGKVYVVKPNRAKSAVYAKEIVESPARMTESGMQVDFEAVYAPGIVYSLTEADRMELADAQDFLTKYARCIVCGRHLKAAKSVARAIGPVCAGYFKNSSHVNGCAHHDDNSAAPQGAAAAVEPDAQIERDEFARETAPVTAEDAWQARLNEAKANAHKVSQELLDYIKDENEVARRWMAAGTGRFAGILAEEPEHWALYGTYTLADYKRDQALCDAKEARKASYDWQPPTAEDEAAVAAHNAEWQALRKQVAQERHDREVYEHHMEEAMVGLL